MTKIKIGNQALKNAPKEVKGAFVDIAGKEFYKIEAVDAMAPFFMTIVSPYDHWLFIASNGGLTAGRGGAHKAIFPYYTDDKIVDNAEMTGSKTLLRVSNPDNAEEAWLWEPFSSSYRGVYQIQRNLYKSTLADQVCFEERNEDLQLTFRYFWGFSKQYGLVKKSEVHYWGPGKREMEVLDGLQNLLPYGVDNMMQDSRSTLVDAYKKNELVSETGLAIYSLSSNIVDKAEPSESLMANVVWCNDKPQQVLLSNKQLSAFRHGEALQTESFTKAEKASFYALRSLALHAGQSAEWFTVAEVALSTARVMNLNQKLKQTDLSEQLKADLDASGRELKALVASADGLQASGDAMVQTRHYGNVLYNIMRGGLFEDTYQIRTSDFKKYLKHSNKKLYLQQEKALEGLAEQMTYGSLLDWANQSGSADLARLSTEYLPLSFSRRHGDPSRPWNRFNIERYDQEGERVLNYEGNWRDIFQNWEALAYSYPRFIEGMILKFLNASTLDGYNPYRIEKEGIDWEIIEPHDPWSFIGYWGDHQIIYLFRLLEHCEAHYPGQLSGWLKDERFVYADVPYRQKSFAEILADPQDTIDFDADQHRLTEERFRHLGSDGKIVWEGENILRANFAEKLLLPALTKIYNLVPDGGIWMNTQRPEWNDANNALVGNGLSMVTLYYLRPYLRFVKDRILPQTEELSLNSALVDLLRSERQALTDYPSADASAHDRYLFIQQMGLAGEQYRNRAYAKDLGQREVLKRSEIVDFIDAVLAIIDRSIAANEQENGLYHAYNLLKVEGQDAQIEYLYEMLEGQVSALTAEYLQPAQALKLLDAMKGSALFRPDQYSYLLYPDRELPAFMAKNQISAERLAGSNLLPQLEAKQERALVEKDATGVYHFLGHIHNAKVLKADLQDLVAQGYEVSEEEQNFWLKLYEECFVHSAFTGRSGTFYGYEGLGSIYWHMVSKLLLATQENLRRARANGADPSTIARLIEHYYEIRAGIGANKDPKLYGAFPFDAYSHTPSTAGAQQPGLTGQVKEDVISRWAELGIQVVNGEIHLDPFFLSTAESLPEARSFEYLGADGQWKQKELQAGDFAFTYCGTLFVYRRSEQNALTVLMKDGSENNLSGNCIPAAISQHLFDRDGQVEEVFFQGPFNF